MILKMYVKDYDTFKYIEELSNKFNLSYEFFGIYENKKRTSTCMILKDIKNTYQSDNKLKVQTEEATFYLDTTSIDGIITMYK